MSKKGGLVLGAIYASETEELYLGRVGENDRTMVIFDDIVQKWLAEYPGAQFLVINRPSRQDQGYPVGTAVQTEAAVRWTVKSADLSEAGYGECQLVAMQGEAIVKSKHWRTRVLASLDGSATPPEPWKSWQIAFLGMKNAAEAAAADAQEAASHYPLIVNRIWLVWDVVTGAYVSTGIVAEGQNGFSPVLASEPIAGGHRLTIVDAEHPDGFTVDVMNGVSAYVHYRWASHEPTQDSDMSTDPGPWQGVYSGSSATAPEHYTDYTWNNVQGPQGPQGLAFTFEDGGTGLILKPIEQEV